MRKPLSQRQLDALLQQALALQQNGAWTEAAEIYREILAVRPQHFDALQLLGTLALQTGHLDEGIALLQTALSINGKQAAIHSNLAFALNARSRHREALGRANQALALMPNFVDALTNRGMALGALDMPAEALESLDRALALKPEMPEAWNNRSCVLRDLGRPEEAVTNCDRALALRPDYAEAWSNRGNALSDLNRPAEAEESYRKAIAAAPGLADAWSNLGLALIDMNRHADALASYDQALALQPDHVEGHWNRALCLLQMGRLEEGWHEYEWRWKRRRNAAEARSFEAPLWLGDAPLDGKVILLHAEQGLGDTLQFCRYASMLARRGAQVVLEVQPELVRLLAPLEGVARIVAQGEPLPPFDLHCPLLSLPLAFETDVASIPGATPYLFADSQAVRHWEAKVSQAAGSPALKVGLVWAGGDRSHVPELRKNDRRRSIALEQMLPLFDVPGIRFFSLQKGAPAQQLAALRERREGNRPGAEIDDIVDFTGELADFADTAALVSNLDLVISVDTSTAHLAGAMGKPVWILNRFDTCWRWMLERSDTPWYPGARLFRQPALGDWGSVLAAVREALTARVATIPS
ncbi:tetratricopeptide repeat protein [Paraburkholderia acidipaludis]|uniref:tetratricopeptide repeat protein n=1 Tax=Paraburkholderia acidipaludis TaxID=660537 RepID=UPI0004897E40|nr:tetratricopeptide repeat protein [Paraburkholderia acidipaludis]